MSETGDQSRGDDVSRRSRDDRDRRCRLPRRVYARGMGDDDVHIERGQFAGERGQARVIAVGIAKFETQVLPLDITEVAKPLLKFAADPLRPLPSVGYAEIADRHDPFWSLRGRRERPCRRPADEADEFASSHSITLALDEVVPTTVIPPQKPV